MSGPPNVFTLTIAAIIALGVANVWHGFIHLYVYRKEEIPFKRIFLKFPGDSGAIDTGVLTRQRPKYPLSQPIIGQERHNSSGRVAVADD